MKDKEFYMVFVENQQAPTYKHTTLIRAETEAKRLANITGEKSYVLCALKSFEINEFIIRDCRPENEDLPF